MSDPLIDAAVAHISEVAKTSLNESFSQDIRQIIDTVHTMHPTERLQVAAAVLNSVARDKETEPGMRDKCLKLMQQCDRLADAW